MEKSSELGEHPEMNKEVTINGLLGEGPALVPRVTTRMLWSMTVELAVNAGRSPVEVTQTDFEQAKLKLTGETDFDRQEQCFTMGCSPTYWPAGRKLINPSAQAVPQR